jgi:hypothetical protein
MHRSLRDLRVSEDEHDLESRDRLRRLYRSKHATAIFGGLGFCGFALICVVAAVALRDVFVAAFLACFILGFGLFGAMFLWPYFADPLLGAADAPTDDFVGARIAQPAA